MIACNRDAQIWGWFDVKDNRHWPDGKAADAKHSEAKAGAKPGDIAAAYVAKDSEASPQGRSLEELRLRFVNNVYFASPGQKWFAWGVTWGKHESYSSLSDFQTALGIDTHSRVLDPGFADAVARDYRLSSEMMSQIEESYPRGPIPDVLLGVHQH